MVKKLEIKNLKVAEFMSEKTLAFTASLWVDGKKVGETKNQGHGGNNHVDLFNKDGRLSPGWNSELFKELEEFASQHTYSYEGETHTHSLDSYIGDLVDNVYEKQHLKRRLRGKTAYRTSSKSYKEGEYNIMSRKYTKEVGEVLRQLHGDDVFILNETV